MATRRLAVVVPAGSAPAVLAAAVPIVLVVLPGSAAPVAVVMPVAVAVFER